MSWLFSQALAEEYSVDTSLAGEQFAQLNVMPTQHKFSRNDKTMEFSDLSRFGLTCAALTESRGEELLMSFLAGFRARTLALPDVAQASEVVDLDYGKKWQESSVRFDLDSSSWKTHPCSSNEVLPWSSVILPKWGMTASGSVYRHRTAERPKKETASGLWPTPKATDGTKGCRTLAGARKEAQRGKNMDLWMAILLRTSEVDHIQNGRLNPEWEEWLMGWPIGWTELKPLAMDKFREWQLQHSPCLKQIEDAA